MNKAIIIIGALSLTGCSTIDRLNYLVNESTSAIQQNTCVIEQNTQTILINASLVNESTQSLIENQQSLEKARRESANEDSETEALEEVDVDTKKDEDE